MKDTTKKCKKTHYIRIERNLEEMKRDIERKNEPEAEKGEWGRRNRNGSADNGKCEGFF